MRIIKKCNVVFVTVSIIFISFLLFFCNSCAPADAVAEVNGVKITKDQLNDAIDEITQNYGFDSSDQDSLDILLWSSGISEQELKARLVRLLVQSEIYDQILQKYNINVTNEDIDDVIYSGDLDDDSSTDSKEGKKGDYDDQFSDLSAASNSSSLLERQVAYKKKIVVNKALPQIINDTNVDKDAIDEFVKQYGSNFNNSVGYLSVKIDDSSVLDINNVEQILQKYSDDFYSAIQTLEDADASHVSFENCVVYSSFNTDTELDKTAISNPNIGQISKCMYNGGTAFIQAVDKVSCPTPLNNLEDLNQQTRNYVKAYILFKMQNKTLDDVLDDVYKSFKVKFYN